MSQHRSDAQSAAVNRFWIGYMDALAAEGVPLRSRPWYRKRVEHYIAAHPGRKLVSHGADDVSRYLESAGRAHRLLDWQFRQLADALRILFARYVRAAWADGYAWREWAEMAASLDASHPTRLRDDVSPGAGEQRARRTGNSLAAAFRARRPELLERVTHELRRRRLAVRTETTYLHWIGRFLAFHDWPDAAVLDGDRVAAFLDHLAMRRKVAASTQNIALNALVFLYREVLGHVVEALPGFRRAPAASACRWCCRARRCGACSTPCRARRG